MRTNRLIAAAAALACLLAAAPSLRAPASAAEASCEGDACPCVSLSFDEARRQYRARNDSPDRWARLSASNVAAAASACLAPGGGEYLALKSVVGAYRAEYSEPKCGARGLGH
jgi:hypothetical protein